MLKKILIAAALTSASACASSPTIMVNRIEVYENYWQRTLGQLGRRASFDLKCPANQINFTLFRKLGRTPVEVGADGCGKRAVYVKPSMAGTAADHWLLNSCSQ